jgi:hypothetical protein
LEENVSYVIILNNSWIYLQGLENPGLLRPLTRAGDLYLFRSEVGA